MSSMRWLPWRWLIRRISRRYGILDPFMLLARLRRFSEPAEVAAPIELIRAWIVFQARGVVNTQAIQHNLDWIWPYWVERQFDPRDPSFIPRSFSLAHINLTHRNWTAVCLPDTDAYALVDPRGLLTPLHDGWSLEGWLLSGKHALVPGRCQTATQRMRHDRELAIETTLQQGQATLKQHAEMRRGEEGPVLTATWEVAHGDPSALFCVALRPYNPEGIQFIDDVALLEDRAGWRVNDKHFVRFDRPPARYAASTYERGDVFHLLDGEPRPSETTHCKVGMATAAALFPLDADGRTTVTVSVPVRNAGVPSIWPARVACRPATSWAELDERSPTLSIPDRGLADTYHAAVRTLLSLSAGDVVPGSYTYRRFWVRDACLMLNALLALNHDEPCRRAFDHSLPQRQTSRGYFESQEGEWDANGQVLWLAGRYAALTRQPFTDKDLALLRKGADWLCRKRHSRAGKHPGLLPAGFSAEHLGPNNYYYWDNFWGLAGLRSVAAVFDAAGDRTTARRIEATADEYAQCIDATIASLPDARCSGAIPAAPNRRLDAGAVGSLVADYPLRIYEPGSPRIMRTLNFLMENCLVENGFFHDMTHSGINPYLTLHLAQVLLRAGDPRFAALVRRVGELASPTGQWPEAVHPATGGGCMGDGQHGWAAAEWVLMIRALFVREEDDRLVVASGLFPDWLQSSTTLRYGPAATPFGDVTVTVETGREPPLVRVEGAWHAEAPPIEVALPGHPDATLEVECTKTNKQKPDKRTPR